ncbi:MAG TPA: class I SAM-dependent methyltransferase [Marmoricola sp.]|nr:class I SAM-dependent methyltransferase [Marmoricola sp.]
MSLWEEHVVPILVDKACGAGAIHKERQVVCAPLSGRVLEVGFGSGLNAGHYPSAVTSIAAVEPSDRGWAMSAGRRNGSPITIERTGLDGQALTEDDNSCDSALITFSLCTIPDPMRALREVARVLRPGGALAFLEHGLAPDAKVATWQRRLDPIERRLAGGCELSRDIPALVRESGFEIVEMETKYLPGPGVMRPWMHGYRGLAVVA